MCHMHRQPAQQYICSRAFDWTLPASWWKETDREYEYMRDKLPDKPKAFWVTDDEVLLCPFAFDLCFRGQWAPSTTVILCLWLMHGEGEHLSLQSSCRMSFPRESSWWTRGVRRGMRDEGEVMRKAHWIQTLEHPVLQLLNPAGCREIVLRSTPIFDLFPNEQQGNGLVVSQHDQLWSASCCRRMYWTTGGAKDSEITLTYLRLHRGHEIWLLVFSLIVENRSNLFVTMLHQRDRWASLSPTLCWHHVLALSFTCVTVFVCPVWTLQRGHKAAPAW